MRLPLLAALAFLAALPALAIQPFTIRDIRIEGVQRTDAGTVFTYLPVKVGETLDDEKSAQAIKALYATGFYNDVRLEVDGDVLIVFVQERPSIAQIDIEGAKEFTKDALKDGLKQAGIAEAKIFDKSVADRAEKEIKRQYTSRGFYAAKVTVTVTPLERNRVALRLDIDEGEVTRIADINIIGAKDFSERELLRQMQLTTPGWLTFITKDDQYSKQKLGADLETLRSFYLNRGYLEFNIDSTQVSITPDKEHIYITIAITEGPLYRFGPVKLSGETIAPEDELYGIITVREGEIFSRERIIETTKRITDRLGNDGYSFANVNPVPDINRDTRVASFTLFVDPGRRVYVRRITMAGNQKTQDQVIRREMRQLEASWYSLEKIARSKERLQRTGYFSEVNIETPSVPGTQDQVDVNVTVVERNTGSLNFGLGYSTADKLTVTASVTQANILGTGNQLSLALNTGSVNQVYSLSFLDPYWTVDGIGFGWDIFQRNVDTSSLSVASYTTNTTGAGIRFAVPVTEFDTITTGLAVEKTKLSLDPFTASIQYIEFVLIFGENTTTFRYNIGYSRDTRDSLVYPTKGRLLEIGAEVGMPPGDLTYYRVQGLVQQLYTFQALPWLTVLGNLELGYADGYDNKPLPFFKNFYAGGVGSVRGYQTASLGPQDLAGNAVGGNRRFVANLELLFPIPGMKENKAVRLSTFLDAGQVWGAFQQVSASDLRWSTGAAVSWDSPVGPLKFSIAYPFRTQPQDKLERFQFQLGRIF